MHFYQMLKADGAVMNVEWKKKRKCLLWYMFSDTLGPVCHPCVKSSPGQSTPADTSSCFGLFPFTLLSQRNTPTKHFSHSRWVKTTLLTSLSSFYVLFSWLMYCSIYNCFHCFLNLSSIWALNTTLFTWTWWLIFCWLFQTCYCLIRLLCSLF